MQNYSLVYTEASTEASFCNLCDASKQNISNAVKEYVW